MKPMFWIFIVFVLISILWGFNQIPKKRVLKKEYHFEKAPSMVWKQIRDIVGQKKWRSDITEIAILSVEPEIWKETNSNGYETVFQTIEISEPVKWVIQVKEPSYIQATWKGILIPKDRGTTVIFEESIEINSFPYRILSYLFFDLEKLMFTYLKDLSNALEEPWDERKVKTTME